MKLQKVILPCRGKIKDCSGIDHFVGADKMVKIGSGAEREIEDIMLTQRNMANLCVLRVLCG